MEKKPKQPFDINGRLLKVGDPVTGVYPGVHDGKVHTGKVVSLPRGCLVEVRHDQDGLVWSGAARNWRFGVNTKPVPKLCDTHEALRTAIQEEARRVYGVDFYIKQLRAVPGELLIGTLGRELRIWEPTYAEAQKTALTCLKALPTLKRPKAKKPRGK